MNAWEVAIINCIKSCSGTADLRQIYDSIGKFIELSDEHFKEHYGRPAYQHQIRSHITNLCQAGDLVWISRGRYSVTEKGEAKSK